MMKLTAKPALDGFEKDTGDVALKELTDRAIVSLACPNGGKTKLTAAIKKAWGLSWPKVGKVRKAKGVQLLGLQPDQAFAIFERQNDTPVTDIAKALGGTAYLTDQSDSWVALKITGPGARPALERICMLDLDPKAFPPGKVARTAMEHLGTVITCDAADIYTLLSARSSARSFLHALTVSIDNTIAKD